MSNQKARNSSSNYVITKEDTWNIAVSQTITDGVVSIINWAFNVTPSIEDYIVYNGAGIYEVKITGIYEIDVNIAWAATTPAAVVGLRKVFIDVDNNGVENASSSQPATPGITFNTMQHISKRSKLNAGQQFSIKVQHTQGSDLDINGIGTSASRLTTLDIMYSES